MSEKSTTKGPCPAYLEEVHEESQTPISGSRQTANTAAKRSKEVRRSKRDGASDSGYSSRTAATTGSSSLASKSGSASKNVLTLLTRNLKMASSGKKSQNKEPSPPPKSQAKKPISRVPKKDNLREDVEGREDAAKMRLSGGTARKTKSNAVHQHPPEAQQSQPPTKTSGATPSAARPIPIQNIATNPPQRRTSQGARPAPRPVSYAGPPISQPTMFAPPQIIHHRQQLPPLSMPNTMYATYPSPAVAITPTLLPGSPNRQIAYSFPHTTPQYHLVPQSNPEIFYPQPPTYSYAPVSRRFSTHGPSPVDHPLGPSPYHAVQYPSSDFTARRRSINYIDQHPIMPSAFEDEAVFVEDPNEAYYRRSLMPPPPIPARPAMRHSVTTSAAVPKRVDGGLSRTPSMKGTARTVEAPTPPTTAHRRTSRPRPMSYHGGIDPIKQAEEYQETQTGPARGIPLTADAIKKANRKKSKSKGGSETASRQSTSREGSEAKKRESLGVSIQTKDGMRVEYNDGQIKFWQNHNRDGPVDTIVGGGGGSRGSSYRDSRSGMREGGSERDRRYRVTHVSRRIKEYGEPRAESRQRSSTRSIVPPRVREGSQEEHEKGIRNLRAEVAHSTRQENPIEDDEESETAREFERLTMERVRRQRTESRTRRSSKVIVDSRLSRGHETVRPNTEFGENFI